MTRLILLLALAASAEDATLTTPTGTIRGTLLVPASASPVPVVLLIAGAGPTDRDGNPFGSPGRSDSLKLLAESLAKYGIASLRYDKRGVGASAAAAPLEIDLRFEMYVDDVIAWGEQLLGDPRFASVTIAGHSEGALIGTLAAQRIPVRSIVSIAGAGRRAGDVILEQLEAQTSGDTLQNARDIVAALNAGNTTSNVRAELLLLFRPTVQPYLISWFRYDPATEISRLDIPALIVQGTSDIQVKVIDAQLLQAAAQRGSLNVIDGMNHVLKRVGTDPEAQRRSYVDPSFPVDDRLVAAMAHFIKPTTRRRSVTSLSTSTAPSDR